MRVLDVYRHETNGSLSWVSSVNSVKLARVLIRSRATTPSDEFLIYDDCTNEGLTLRADGHWLAANLPLDSVSSRARL
jgi:hypothetical protein